MAAATIEVGVVARAVGVKSLELVHRNTVIAAGSAGKIAKGAASLGSMPGMDRVAAGMRTIGTNINRSLTILEHIKPLLAGIAGAGSLSAITAAADKWASTGQSLANLSYRLNTPVEEIEDVRGALGQVGGSIAAADAGMRGVQASLSSAQWGRSAEAMQAWKELGIGVGDARTGGKTLQIREAMDKLATALEGKTADAQARALARVGIVGDAWLKALGHGPAFWRGLQARAHDTGGAMTDAMVRHAELMTGSWSRLSQALDGVRNRLIDKYSPWITGAIDRLTSFVVTYGRPLLIVSGFLGVVRGGFDRGRALGASSKEAIEFFISKGWTEEQAAGLVGGLVQESGLSPLAGAGSTHQGIAQWDAPRQARIEAHFGKRLLEMTRREQLEAIHWELTEGSEQPAGLMLRHARTVPEAAEAAVTGYERPGNYGWEIPHRTRLGERALREYRAPIEPPASGLPGGIPSAFAKPAAPHVEVRIHDAPQGTTGEIRTEGAVTAAPLVVN